MRVTVKSELTRQKRRQGGDKTHHGTGKTALARAISAVIDGTHSRIQFTPDLLPSDVTGDGIHCVKEYYPKWYDYLEHNYVLP